MIVGYFRFATCLFIILPFTQASAFFNCFGSESSKKQAMLTAFFSALLVDSNDRTISSQTKKAFEKSLDHIDIKLDQLARRQNGEETSVLYDPFNTACHKLAQEMAKAFEDHQGIFRGPKRFNVLTRIVENFMFDGERWGKYDVFVQQAARDIVTRCTDHMCQEHIHKIDQMMKRSALDLLAAGKGDEDFQVNFSVKRHADVPWNMSRYSGSYNPDMHQSPVKKIAVHLHRKGEGDQPPPYSYHAGCHNPYGGPASFSAYPFVGKGRYLDQH